MGKCFNVQIKCRETELCTAYFATLTYVPKVPLLLCTLLRNSKTRKAFKKPLEFSVLQPFFKPHLALVCHFRPCLLTEVGGGTFHPKLALHMSLSKN